MIFKMFCLTKFFIIVKVTLYLSGLSESSVINDHELYDSYPEQRSVRSSEDSCIYTFNVPRTDANACPPGSSEVTKENLKDFKESLLSQFTALREQITNLSQQILSSNLSASNDDKPNQIGIHYTRWGSTSCPGDADLIYTGFAGKSHFTHGGGVNYLCLPKNPDFDESMPSGFQSGSYIYGVEYEHGGSPIFSAEKSNNDAPCSVCHVSGRGQQLMIPAKKTCPEDWTLEYQGILMAQHNSQKGSDYACVDKSMEDLHGGSPDSNGGLFYAVESHCGSLKCPPYENGKEILCVVCTK